MLRVDPNDYSAAKRQYTDITQQTHHQAHTLGKDGLQEAQSLHEIPISQSDASWN